MSFSISRGEYKVSGGIVDGLRVVDPSVYDQPCAVESSTGGVGLKALSSRRPTEDELRQHFLKKCFSSRRQGTEFWCAGITCANFE